MNASLLLETGASLQDEAAELIRVCGLVQGVGFRPTVYRLAERHGVRGSVANDSQGVTIHAAAPLEVLDAFVAAIRAEAPPLARIDSIQRQRVEEAPRQNSFQIAASTVLAAITTGIVPDAAPCSDCQAEVRDPFSRRFRYPFTNCTHCGPRLSIVEAIPYDRAATTMRGFPLCPACEAEYADPGDRRFHAQPIACHVCGPRAWLERADGAALAVDALSTLDAVDAACTLLQRGEVVAIKGLGGFQLACDATNEKAVMRLRTAKGRRAKPLALLARDLDVIRRYCPVSAAEAALLASSAAPIVILQKEGPEPKSPSARAGGGVADVVPAVTPAGLPALAAPVAPSVAPGLSSLGFMLPNTPLHQLMLRRMDRPIVMTSGNLSEEPQCIENADARTRLFGIADYFLFHDRDIARRIDDSVARVVAGEPRLYRRARGYAPAPLKLPAGFEEVPALLAMGGELKSTFCLVQGGQAIVSHHIGDLADARTHADYVEAIAAYRKLFAHPKGPIAVDLHPGYRSRSLGMALAEDEGALIVEVQHHHAHIAACMAENGVALDAPPVLGVALDGLGWGADGALWGGEFLLAGYRDYTRLATFKPVALPGGEKAMVEPWRNTLAHLLAEMGWARFAMNYRELELHRFLEGKPHASLAAMIERGVNSPLASSCGRLFDAAAAAAGVSSEHALYEGQAAMEFESLIDLRTLADEDDELAYPFSIPRLAATRMPYIEPLAMWQALLGDLILKTPTGVIAARFHKGLALAIVRMLEKLSGSEALGRGSRSVALSGGVFQNKVLLEEVTRRLEALDYQVFSHRLVPSGDGGLCLGQAAVAAARLMH